MSGSGLAVEMAALFRKTLILDVNPGHAPLFELSHRADHVQLVAFPACDSAQGRAPEQIGAYLAAAAALPLCVAAGGWIRATILCTRYFTAGRSRAGKSQS